MTINDLFQYAEAHPANVVFYFCIIPFAALLAGWMEREEGHLPPWNYLYSTLVYLVAVPAILAVAYGVYSWLFERRSIRDANILLQLLPIASMLLTFFLVKKQVRIDSLPGFSRLGGLVMMISAALAIMWFIDKVRIVAFTYMPIQYLLVIFLVLLVVIRVGWTRIAK
jgi:drug/metabolite transporter superfamily protein YnfA